MGAVDGGERISVLHVDDEPGLAEMTARYLEREDDRFTVETATSAAAGLNRIAAGRIDCVVSDYEMPGRDGIDFLRAVRERHPEMPFILYTGRGSEEIASDAISAGVTDYLQKGTDPGTYSVLANRIENAVERQRAQRELANREARLDLLFAQSPIGVIEWTKEFEFIRLNARAESILGYDTEELAGDSWERIVPERDHSAVGDAIEKLQRGAGGETLVNANVRGDGTEITCEWHNRYVTDEQASVAAVFSMFWDVTENQLKNERLGALGETFPGMIYRCLNEPGWPMVDVLGEVEQLTGYPPETLVETDGFYGERVIHPEDKTTVWETVQAAVESGEPFEIRYRIRTRDGEVKQVWERGRAVYDDHGQVTALDGFITELSAMEST